MNIRPLGDELFHMDGLTDMTKLIVAFRNFVNALKIHSLPDTYWYERFSLFLCELTLAICPSTLYTSCI